MRKKLRLHHVVWALGGLLGLGLAFSRLLGVHGPESALALGIALPPFCGAIGARAVIQARAELEESVLRVWKRAIGRALVVWAVPVLLLALNQLRVRNCTPIEGAAFMFLGPGLGSVLACVIGVWVATWISKPRLATTIAVLVPIAGYASGVWAFWSTPAIFVYDHFGGWFPGTLYDEDVGLPQTLVTFRLVTLAWIGSVIGIVTSTWQAGRPDDLATFLQGRVPRPFSAVVAIVLATSAVVAHRYGPELAHRSSAVGIDDALGRVASGDRCVVHAPRELSPDALRRMVDDCDFRVARAEQALGVTQREPVHAYFYRNAEEKRRWMGAGRTYIAKPWRTEVHLQIRGWPHSVLAHEVVHVVAGNAANGPFRVSGTLGGWLPNPGLIEGIAVAVEWPERDGMNPHQFARAMRELEQLPALDDLMGLSFLSLPARRAYTGAGSFVRWMLDTKGTDVVRRIHRAGTFDGLEALETDWLAFLDSQELPPGARELTQLRFHRASIFQTTCPHAVARLRGELSLDLASGDDRRALETCDAILDIEPSDLSALVTKPGALARRGQLDDAAASLEGLEGAPPPLVARARESLADAHWLRGDATTALAIYEELLEIPQSDDEARAREVKSIALRTGGPQTRLVRDLLVGPHGRSVSSPIAVHLAREIDRFRPDGLGRYLEARQLVGQERFDLALPPIREARRRGLPSERLEDEALRMEGIIRFATGDLDGAEARFREAMDRSRLRNTATEWLDRIRFHRERHSLN